MNKPLLPPSLAATPVTHHSSLASDISPCCYEGCHHLAPWNAEFGDYICFNHYDQLKTAQRARDKHPAGQPIAFIIRSK